MILENLVENEIISKYEKQVIEEKMRNLGLSEYKLFRTLLYRNLISTSYMSNLSSVLSKLMYALGRMNLRDTKTLKYGYIRSFRLLEEEIEIEIIKCNPFTCWAIFIVEIKDFANPDVYIRLADCSDRCPIARNGECHPLREVGCRIDELKVLEEELKHYYRGIVD